VLASGAVSLDPFLGAARLAALVRSRQASPVELVRAYLDRIEQLDGRLRAYITVTRQGALDAARRAEETAGRSGALGPLHGVPFAVKDQFATRGVRTTAGSRILADHVPDEDATVVARLVAAGGILLGKLNLTEFALGGTIRFPFGQPRNPWNPAHDTGGSSAGSGVAAAAALAAVTLGEDTGGSVRTPASWCGVAGHRPTWGLVSRHGCIPLSWSLDAAGPLGRTVEDCALVLEIIAGHDTRDPLTARRPVPGYRAALTGEVRGLRVGVIRELTHGGETDPEVRDAVVAAAGVLGGLGAKVDEVSVPLAARPRRRLRPGHPPPPARGEPAASRAAAPGAAGPRARPPAAARCAGDARRAARPDVAPRRADDRRLHRADHQHGRGGRALLHPALVHHAGGPGRRARAGRAVRVRRLGPAAQPAGHRPALRGRHRAARGPRLRASHRLAPPTAPTLSQMSELTEAQVRALAQALGLPMTPDDAAEVTHRLNAFIEALAPLTDLPSAGPEPTPAPIDPDGA